MSSVKQNDMQHNFGFVQYVVSYPFWWGASPFIMPAIVRGNKMVNF